MRCRANPPPPRLARGTAVSGMEPPRQVKQTRHFQSWWKERFGFIPQGDRVLCVLCQRSVVTRTSSVRRHFNTKHGPFIPPERRAEAIAACLESFQRRGGTSSPRRVRASTPKQVQEERRKRSPLPEPQQICLRWNTYDVNLKTAIPNLLLSETFTDITLACEGKQLKAHKIILSACSNYFRDILCEHPSQHVVVVLKDFKFWEVQALVEFMYRGEVNVAEEKLLSLLKAAEELHVKGLTSQGKTTDEDLVEEQVRDQVVEEDPQSPRYLWKKRKVSNVPIPHDLLPPLQESTSYKRRGSKTVENQIGLSRKSSDIVCAPDLPTLIKEEKIEDEGSGLEMAMVDGNLCTEEEGASSNENDTDFEENSTGSEKYENLGLSNVMHTRSHIKLKNRKDPNSHIIENT